MFGLVKWKWSRDPERVVDEHRVLLKFLSDVEFGEFKSLGEAKQKAKQISRDIAFGNPFKEDSQ
jgi:hypothetical protein